MQGESNPPAFPRDVLLLSCMFFLFVVSIVSPLYVATTTPAETSDAVGDGQFTTTWKVNTVIERSEWSNATPILGIENSTLSSSNEFQATSSIFEPSGDDVFQRMNRAARIQMFLFATLTGALIARCHRPVRSKLAQHGPILFASALISLVGIWGLSGLVNDAGEQAAIRLEVDEIPSIDTDLFGGGTVKQEDVQTPFDVDISWRPSIWILAPLLLIVASIILMASEIRFLFNEDHPSLHSAHASIGDWAPIIAGGLAALFALIALLSPWYVASTLNTDSSDLLQGTGNESVSVGLWSASQITENQDLVASTESIDRGPTSSLAPLTEHLDSMKWWLILIFLILITGLVTFFLPENQRVRTFSPIFLMIASSLIIFIGVADLSSPDSGFSSLDGDDISIPTALSDSDSTRLTSSSTISHGTVTSPSGDIIDSGSLTSTSNIDRSLGSNIVVLLLFISILIFSFTLLSSLFTGWENSDFDFDDWLVAQRGRVRAFGPIAAVILIGASITGSLLIVERTQRNPFFGTSESQTLIITSDSISTEDVVYDMYEVTPQFVCTNGDRINPLFVNDGSEDCGDGSDESSTAVEPDSVLIWSAPSGGRISHDSSENEATSLSDEVIDGRLIRLGSFAIALLLFAFAAALPNSPSPKIHQRRHLIGSIGWGLLTCSMLLLLFQHASIAEAFADDILAGFTGEASDAITNLERGRWGRFTSDVGLSYDWSPGSSSFFTLIAFIVCLSITIAHIIEFTERRTWDVIEVWSAKPTLSTPSGSEDILPVDEKTLNIASLTIAVIILIGIGFSVVGPWWSSTSTYLLPNEPADDESQLPDGSTNSELLTSIGLWGLRIDELPDNDTRAQLLTDGEQVNTTRTQNGGEINLLDTGRLITSMRAPAISVFFLSISLTTILFMSWRQIPLPLGLQEISKFLVALIAICLVLTIEIGVTEFESEIERTLRLDGRPESGSEGISRATISVSVENVPDALAHEEIRWNLDWGWTGLLIARSFTWFFAIFALTRFLTSEIDYKSYLLSLKNPANATFTSFAIVITIIGAGMGNVFAVATGISEKVGSDDGLRTWDISLSLNNENFLSEQIEMGDDETTQFPIDLSQSIPMMSDIRQVIITIGCDEGATAFGGGEDTDSIEFTISPPPNLQDYLISGPLTNTVGCDQPPSQTEWRWSGLDDIPETVDSVSGDEAISPYQFSDFESNWNIEVISNVEGDGIPVGPVQEPTGDDQLFANVEINGESFEISASRQTS